MLDESQEERKWPHWLKYVLIAHVVTLVWAMASIPGAGTIEIAWVIVLMWLPLFVFAGYFFERPKLSIEWYRRIYVILALVAIFFNVVLALAFIE
jgi:hypothetical protein